MTSQVGRNQATADRHHFPKMSSMEYNGVLHNMEYNSFTACSLGHVTTCDIKIITFYASEPF